ncbi:MAG: hypothetical protein PHQ04_02015 [Opitutaceae bacterium]|nr:hypothetical protein [Opitutaceae bacterium]
MNNYQIIAAVTVATLVWCGAYAYMVRRLIIGKKRRRMPHQSVAIGYWTVPAVIAGVGYRYLPGKDRLTVSLLVLAWGIVAVIPIIWLAKKYLERLRESKPSNPDRAETQRP